MSGDPHGSSAAFGAVCTCGHAADWHSHGGAGDCEHDAECGCGVYREAITCEPGCACGDPTLCGTAPPEEVHIAQRERGPGQLTDYWTRRDLASSTCVSGASMSGDPKDVSRCIDPLADARVVLQHIHIENPSSRPDTEDAANRVALALRYLDMALGSTGGR